MAGLTLDNPIKYGVAINSEYVIPGDVLNLRTGIYRGDILTRFEGSQENTITVMPYQNETPVIDGSITIYLGEWIVLKNLHIKDADFLDRITEEAGSTPSDIPPREAIKVSKNNILLQDCVIENCRQGILKNSQVSGLIVDGCVIFHCGWIGPDRPHGHGGYFPSQFTTMQNCILHTNFEFGTKVYDEGTARPPIDDNIMQDNIAFNNSVIGGQVGTRGDLMFGHNDLPFYRPIMRRNYTYQAAAYLVPDGSGLINTNWLGYKQPFYDAILVDNYMPNNLIVTDELGSTFLENSGNVIAPEVTNKVVLIPVRGRLHCAIYNWELLTSVSVDLSAYWSPGDTVQMTQVTDLFVDIDTQVIAGDGTITIDMQAVSHTVQTPQGMSAPDSCFPEFGCFILEKI